MKPQPAANNSYRHSSVRAPNRIASPLRFVLALITAVLFMDAGGAFAAAAVWVEDAPPAGAVLTGSAEGWTWTSTGPAPFSGVSAHPSVLAAGVHQHYFYGSPSPLPVGASDALYTYVYLDPANPPTEVMLQWHDGSSWEHRAYWGANNIGWGVDGTASRRYMGTLPATGQWVRLAVPAAQVGLDGSSVGGMAFTLYDGRATWDRAGVEAGPPLSAVWVDDGVPAGAVLTGTAEGWTWTSTNPAPYSGTLAHQSVLAAGLHQHYFTGASAPLAVGGNDTLYAYVYLDPANPPSEVMLQWRDGASWEHRAYWGANSIGWGTEGTASRRYMGPLPATGQWVRLAVLAAQVGLDGKSVSGMAFSLYDGRATWDRAGVEAGTSPPATAWVDEGMPAGAAPAGVAEGWNWTSTNPAPFSGALAHQSVLAAGVHQHYFTGASVPLPVGANDTLYAYVYLDPANPPTEVMLQWHDGATWKHRAYWGANSIAWGVDGTTSRHYMGPLPPTGQWVRLAVPAVQVGLDGKSVSGMAFALFDGRATWDRAGVETVLPPPTDWVEDVAPAGAVLTGSGEGWTWTNTNPAPFSGALAHQSVLAAGLHQHYFYGASAPVAVGVSDTLFAYVYLDPANPPTEVMLQWHDGATWEHRAYWGANTIGWGVDGTAGRRYMGALPATGQWVRLAVPAAQVGLDGKSISGMAFTLYDGRATWDRAGIATGTPTASTATLTSALNPATFGAAVTFTATVLGTSPTGSVNFADGNAALAGCVPVALTGTGSTKTASCSTHALAVGTHSITVTYGGDANNTASASSPLAQVVSDPSPPAFTDKDAARLLQQSTFGPSSADLTRARQLGVNGWLDEQFGKPLTYSHLQYMRDVKQLTGMEAQEQHAYEAIWQNYLFGADQLRARVAFALSEIIVISNIAPDQNPWALASWMDMLYRNAFGNYRTLLADATLHPAMGYYLNVLGNDRENPAEGYRPNENYARELQQLFTIGLVKLNLDGTPIRDAQGKTTPTYDQSVVEGFAQVFTGWNFAGNNTASDDSFYWPNENWIDPMAVWPTRHSPGTKKLLDGVVLPAGQAPQKDLQDALDLIFNHPNVGPFVSRRLIQFLVTSNPSPGYVARVAAVFNQNGSNVRGDLKAVVRAILTDTEARDLTLAAQPTFGKLREPVIRFTHLLRATGAKAVNGRNSVWWLDSPEDGLGQSPLLAPSVFNFFSPFYTRPGTIAAAGLVAPEFQIHTETQVVGNANFLANVLWNRGFGFDDAGRLTMDLAPWVAIAGNTASLVDQLSLVFTASSMSAATRATLTKALNAIPATNPAERVRAALTLLMVAPDFVVQH